jgi:HEAT repeat protein
MSRRYAAIASALVAATLLGTAVAAAVSPSARSATAGPRQSPSGEGGQPRILNGRVSTQAAGSLQQTFRAAVTAQTDAAWIGYSVPVADRERTMCCWSSGDGTTYISGSVSRGSVPCCGNCRIEPSAGGTSTAAQPATSPPSTGGPIKLEGADRMVVLFRIVDREVERVRAFSEDCELDAGGRQVTWLQDVRPAESVALLSSLIGTDLDRKHRITNAVLSALAMHADPSAIATLERLARSHASTSVRGEAIFWMGQAAGRKAVGTISEAIEKDPETEVKRRAVFALSQLPKSEGVPLLIDIARKNANPVVRKQAIFWLGQSRDPRALEFFAEILK